MVWSKGVIFTAHVDNGRAAKIEQVSLLYLLISQAELELELLEMGCRYRLSSSHETRPLAR